MTARWRRGVLGAGLLVVLALVVAFVHLQPQPNVGSPRTDEASDARPTARPARLEGHGATRADDVAADGGAAPTAEPSYPIAVVDDGGNPVIGAIVRVRRPSFSMFGGGSVVEGQARVAEDGLARIPRQGGQLTIPVPGTEPRETAIRFEVFVEPPPDRPDLGWLVGGPWPPEEDALRLPRGGTIAGIVVDAEGRPLRDVLATVVVAGRNRTARTDPAGRFRLPQLPPGAWDVHLAAPGLHRGRGVLGARLLTGTTNAEIALEVGGFLVVALPAWVPGDGAELMVASSTEAWAATQSTVPIHAGIAAAYGLDRAATYTIYLPAGRAGRTAFAEDVVPREETMSLELAPAVRRTGPIEPPEGLSPSSVHVVARLAGLTIPGTTRRQPDGTWHWEVEGLPDRTVEIVAWIGRRAAPVAEGTLHADAESPVPLRLVRVR